MTYFGFLAVFLVIPLIVVLILYGLDERRERRLPAVLRTWPAWGAVLLHVVIAVIYTTPWDNYLVATGVWYYHPERVTGLTIGWVPIEEYTFFILQSLLAGFWLLFLARRIHLSESRPPAMLGLRAGLLVLLGILVAFGVAILVSGWLPGTYLALILVWALPPIMIQIAWGGHILWQYKALVLTALISTTLYLSLSDSLAIGTGIWTIAPGQSLEIYLGGVLPVEEFIFFLVTNTLLVFGITLALARPSLEQFARLRQRLSRAAIDQQSKTVPLDDLQV
jgi:lycopene cyclase domain-containing protein